MSRGMIQMPGAIRVWSMIDVGQDLGFESALTGRSILPDKFGELAANLAQMAACRYINR